MKKKKLLLLTATFSAACALGLTACDNKSDAHTHTYGEWTIVQESTCTEKGLKESACVDGDSTLQEEIAALGHDYQEFVTPPSCTEQGYTTYICVRCGDTYVDSFVPALGHEYGEDGQCIRGDDRYSVGLSYQLSSSGTAYTVTGIGACTDTDLVIPSAYEGLPVTAIRERAFENNTAITSVVLSSNIESIGNGAFRNCTNLVSASLGKKQAEETASVQRTSYRGARALTATPLAATDSDDELLNGIGAYAFEGCENLTSVDIGDGFTSIGDGAFFSCSSLAEISVGSNLTEIGGSAFKGTAYVQTSMQESDDVVYLVSSDETTKYLLEASTTLDGSYEIEENTTVIAAGAFASCENLTEIVLPEGVQTIGDEAFSGCSSLVSVEIPTTVTTVGENAFSECDSLTDVHYTGSEEDAVEIQLSPDVTVHFNSSSSEEEQTHEHTYEAVTVTEPDCTEYGSVRYSCTECETYYYENTAPHGHEWGEWKVTTPATCTAKGVETRVCLYDSSHTETREIPALGHSYVEKVTAPTCTSQGYTTHTCSRCGASYKDSYTAALGHNYDTENIVWAWSTDHTSATATLTCKNDKTHTQVIEATVKKTTASAACEETGLITYTASITFDGKTFTNAETEMLPALGHDYDTENIVWAWNTDLTSATATLACKNDETHTKTLTAAVTSEITKEATYEEAGLCTYTATVVFEGTSYTDTATEEIPVLVKKETEGLEFTLNEDGKSYTVSGIGTATDTEIVIPSTYEGLPVTAIGEEAFASCRNVTSIEIPDSIVSIGMDAFFACTSLTSIVIPDSVTTMGEFVFEECTGLVSVKLSDSLTELASGMFQVCSSLTKLVIPEGVTSVGGYLVLDCTSLRSITIPKSLIKTGYHSFSLGWARVNANIYYGGTEEEWEALGLSFSTVYYNCETEESSMLIFALNEDGLSYSIVGSIGEAAKIVVPDAYEGLPVTAIGNNAFAGDMAITSVFIPESVTSIGENAFCNCLALTSITVDENNENYYSENNCLIESATGMLLKGCQNSVIPDGVKSIGSYAFSFCLGLTGDLVIPDSVTSIGDYAFYQCRGLTSIVIPDSVTSIGEYAFYNCSGLTSVTIGNNVTSIGSNVFYNTSFYNNSDNWVDDVLYLTATDGKTLYLIKANYSISGEYEIAEGTKVIADDAFYLCNQGLTGNMVIPDSVVSIGDYAFFDCIGLTSVTIGSGVKSIGDYAFAYCSGLTGDLVIPDGVTSIGSSAFSNCSGLTGDLIIPDGVTSIGFQAFFNCNGFNGALVIPDSVTSIGDMAFAYCGKLTSITIGNGVESIGDEAFSECSGLTSITVNEGNAAYYSEGNCLIERATGTLILGCQNSIIPDGVTSIGEYAFYQCSGLTSIVIPDSVESIGDQAFYGCNGLTSAIIGNGVTSIGEWAFTGCSELTSIDIPDSVESIGGSAFSECSGLTSVTIGNGVTSIGENAFINCSSLTSIVIPDGVTSIGSCAFLNCSSLASVTIGNGVTTIGYGAFEGCSSLASVTIGSGVTSIGENAFEYTSFYNDSENWVDNVLYLTATDGTTLYLIKADPSGEYKIAEGTKVIADGAFAWSSGLTNVTIENVTSIGDQAFAYCYGLTSVTIGNGVTSIGDWAFSYCSGLTSVTIGNDMKSIGEYAFNDCNNLTDIYYAGTEEEWNAIDKSDAQIPDSVTIHYNSEIYHDYDMEAIEWTWNEDHTSATATLTCKNDETHTKTLTAAVTSEITKRATCEETGLCIYTATVVFEGNSYTDMVTEEIPVLKETEGLEFTLNEDNTSYTVSGIGTATDTAIVIPSTYEGLPVTAIGDYAFSDCSGLTSVVIPDGVKSIGDYAFAYCSGLTGDLVIPDSVTSIGDQAFCGCNGLTSVVIPNSVTSIGNSAFNGCSELTSVTIGNGVTSINEFAFYGCNKLTSVVIPDSVTSIGNMAFAYCGVTGDLVIPDSVTSIGDMAFADCSWLTSIVIPDSVKSIGECAFAYCSGLTSITVDEGNEIYYSDGNCLIEKETNTLILGCQNSIIPDGVTSIGYSAFAWCIGLTSIVIPDGVESIGSSAFAWCLELTSIVIPDSVMSIGNQAFAYCNGLTSITVDEGNEIYYSEGNCLIEKETNTLILGCQSSVIPDNVTSIGNYAFAGCIGLTSVTIGNGVTSIGDSAFNDCNGLTSVTIGNGVTNIGDMAFYNTSFYNNSENWVDNVLYLTATDGTTLYLIKADSSISGDYEIAEGTKVIADGAFAWCSGLTSIVIPDSVTSIGDLAFAGCSGLTNIVIPDSVTSIGDQAFVGCSGLTSVTIGSGVTSIGNSAFSDCTELTSIFIPNGVTSIGYGAFSGCSGLTSIDIPDSVESIGSYTFGYCNGLTSVTIGSGVTSIGENAFIWCSELTSVTIGNGVTSIGDWAFYGCNYLTDIYYAGTEEEWNTIEKSNAGISDDVTIIFNDTAE